MHEKEIRAIQKSCTPNTLLQIHRHWLECTLKLIQANWNLRHQKTLKIWPFSMPMVAGMYHLNWVLFLWYLNSDQKSSPRILSCWSTRPDFPPLAMYSKSTITKQTYIDLFGSTQPSNVEYHHGKHIDGPQFGKLLAEASVVICPSIMEGWFRHRDISDIDNIICSFGHHINQARAAGALLLTTDGAPTNEFVHATSGVLIEAHLRNGNTESSEVLILCWSMLCRLYGTVKWRAYTCLIILY